MFRLLYPPYVPQVSLVYLNIEMIQHGKSFLKFDCWSNKAFSQTLKMISHVESFLYSDKQGTPEGHTEDTTTETLCYN